MDRMNDDADPGPVEPAEGNAGLAARLPGNIAEPLVVRVELPELVHDPAEDEAAVAIDEIAIRPLADPTAASATTMIELDPAQYAVLPEGTGSAETPEILPTAGFAVPAPGLPSGPTADEDSSRRAPEGLWPSLVYAASLHQVNLGDSPRVRERKALDARIGRRLDGGARFVPVVTRKGGVGTTTITALLGMALAEVRDDRVLAIDAHPDRGTLADRIPQQTRSTVRDLVLHAPSVRDAAGLSEYASRDVTGLEVLASDADPLQGAAFDEDGYNVVADIAARYSSVVLSDGGSGLSHSVMKPVLSRADQLVVVSGGGLDEARLASEALGWLEANGYAELVRRAVIALNTATPGTSLEKLDELEGHFRSRVRAVVRIPFDPELAGGSVFRFDALRPFTRDSVRELAALVMDGLGEPGAVVPALVPSPAPAASASEELR